MIFPCLSVLIVAVVVAFILFLIFSLLQSSSLSTRGGGARTKRPSRLPEASNNRIKMCSTQKLRKHQWVSQQNPLSFHPSDCQIDAILCNSNKSISISCTKYVYKRKLHQNVPFEAKLLCKCCYKTRHHLALIFCFACFVFRQRLDRESLKQSPHLTPEAKWRSREKQVNAHTER